MKMQRKSRNTIKVYLEWMGKFIDFLTTCKAETHEEKIGAFLSHQVNKFHVAASTQKQALCALVFFYKRVVKIELGDLSFCRANRAPRLPEVFSRPEVWRVLDRLDGEGWLWGAIMYGCGLRLEETCQLRVKDVDIDRRMVMVREGKGNKDRTVPLPELLVEPLQKHIRNLSDLHERYAAEKVPVSLPDSLDRKYPNAPYSWEWFWIFPASGPCKDPKWEGKLYHIHQTSVQKRIRAAILAAKIPKKAGCHTFRHSYATHWLENAEGSHEIAIKRLQQMLGHKLITTTMVYLHLVQPKTDVLSPLDSAH
jgi:integron integrase